MNSDHDRDPELEKMLEVLRKTGPSADQISRWQKAKPRTSERFRLVMAASLGFILGAALLMQLHRNDYPAGSEQIVQVSATSSWVYDKF